MNLDELIRHAIAEDMPDGDATTDLLCPEPREAFAEVMAKEDLVLSGRDAFSSTFTTLNPEIEITWFFPNGQCVLKNQTACQIRGDIRSILKGERTALNFLGHLSGIASLTRCFVKEVEGTKTRILDTRKTLPNFRSLEKAAVRDGGGQNHRMNLSEAILIKENHIQLAGGIPQAVQMVRRGSRLPIEVEASQLIQVEQCVALKVNRILLDNMKDEELAQALKMIPPSIKTEASGNMNLERVKAVAELGVDFISVGAITHSAPCADFSLLIKEVQ